MARANTSTFGQFKVLLGDGGTPTELFSVICGLTSKGIQFNSETVTHEVPDCTDEDMPSFKEAGVKSYDISLSGSGMWSQQAHDLLITWWKNGTPKNIKVQYMEATSGQVRDILGPAILTSMGNTVEKGGRLSAELAIVFTEMPTFTDA